MTVSPTMIAIASLRRDGGTQPRDHISLAVAKDYAEAMADGAVMPPVTVYFDGSDYWLADGFHRVEAHGLLDLTEIAADVRQGTRRDAILFSAGANAEHGYRRTNEDKRRAVKVLLADTEWSAWSDREIARRCHVSHPMVAQMRPRPSGNGYQIDSVRTVERGGTVYQQDTAAIGGKAKAAPLKVAGRATERRPDLKFDDHLDQTSMGGAARITGLSVRVIGELARAGEIEGAEKDGSSWRFQSEPLREMVRQARADAQRQPDPLADVVPIEEAEAGAIGTGGFVPDDLPAPAYDHEASMIMLGMCDALDAIVKWPNPAEMLRRWAASVGAGPSLEQVASAAAWLNDFATGWPQAFAARKALVSDMLERISDDVEAIA